jgi:soluble lytic murein transglycosylase-like protein
MKYTNPIKLSILALTLTLLLLSVSASTAFASPKDDPNNWLCILLCIGNQPAPQPTNDYQTLAYQDAVSAGIDPDLFIKQINQESKWNPNAVSPAGAIGIAQIMPDTAREWNVNAWDPTASLHVFSYHMHEYYINEGYDYSKALGDYNAGHSVVLTAEKNCTDWLSCMPTETMKYVHAILD